MGGKKPRVPIPGCVPAGAPARALPVRRWLPILLCIPILALLQLGTPLPAIAQTESEAENPATRQEPEASEEKPGEPEAAESKGDESNGDETEAGESEPEETAEGDAQAETRDKRGMTKEERRKARREQNRARSRSARYARNDAQCCKEQQPSHFPHPASGSAYLNA